MTVLSTVNAIKPERTIWNRMTEAGVSNPLFEALDTFIQRLQELVRQGDSGSVEFFLRDPPTNLLDDHIVGHYSESGLTLLHYAVKRESGAVEVVEALVEYCKDNEEAINAKTKEPDIHESTPLHYAVNTGNLQLVQALLRHPHIDLNIKDNDGCTPLHYACHIGLSSIAIVLKGADFCIANNEKDYPLHIAASEQRKEIFSAIKSDEELMDKLHTEKFASLQDADGNTLLHLAIDAEITDAVDLCLMLGFDLREVNKLKMNSLHVAARRGNVEIAQKLLEKEEENLETFVNSQNKFFATPIYVAAKFGQVKIVEMLLKIGAEIETPNCLGFTPLLAAIRYNNPKCVRALLSAGASIVTRDSKRYYNALLWAVEVQRQDLVKIILAHARKQSETFSESIIWSGKDHHGNSAHHLAAKARNLTILETLVEMNPKALEEKNKEGCTPFHIAMGEGKIRIVEYIINRSADSIYSLDREGNTGLHLAAEHGHKAIVEKLVSVHDFGTSMCTRNNSRGHTPLHQAAKNGHWAVLEFLLKHSPTHTIEILDFEHATALYMACKTGHPKCVEVLLQHNAIVTYSYEDKEKNVCKKSCLNVAIDNNHHHVVRVILSSDHWKQALQYSCDPDCGPTAAVTGWRKILVSPLSSKRFNKMPVTPMRKLIVKMPAAAKLAFDRCITDKKTTRAKQVNYNYDFLEDFQDLFVDGGPKFSQPPSGTGTVPVMLRKFVPATSHEVIVEADENDEPDHDTSRPLYQSVTQEHPLGPSHFQHHEPTAHPCVPFHNWGPKEYHHKNHPLHLMVDHERLELLKHDLVASFIHCKWNWIGRYIYYPNIFLYFMLMLVLTIYMHLRFEYSKEFSLSVCESMAYCSIDDDGFRFLNNCTFSDYNITNQDVIFKLRRIRITLIVCACFIIINCVFRILFEFVEIWYRREVYFSSYINYLEGFLYFPTIIFISVDFLVIPCLHSQHWQLGSICIFLSWIHFIIFLREQPSFGIYVVMFQVIIKTFLHMAPMSILLILAFGQPFYILLSTVVSTPPQQFITFPYSLLKTVIMTVGEFETDPIFFSTPSVVEYPGATYLLWIIFLITMPILLQNMLVGLAVDDIKSVQEKAAIKKQSLQIEFILNILSLLPKCLTRYLNTTKREYTRTWGKRFFSKKWKWLSGQAWKPEIKSKDPVAHKLEQVAESVTRLEHKMDSLISEQTAKLERLMLHFSHEQELLLEPARQKSQTSRRRSSSLSQSQPNLSTIQFMEDYEDLV